jgi:protein-tyrosine kinase
VFIVARSQKEPLITLEDPRSPVAEAYRTLRTNLQFAGVAKALRTLVVTSATPSEGKTTTTCNLAVVTAQSGKKVLLIDADLRKPKIHHLFYVSNRIGLTNVLAGQKRLDDAIIPMKEIKDLYVLPSGILPPNPAELLGSQAMKELLEGVLEYFDMVLIDSPPVLAVTDAQVLSTITDGVLLVTAAGKVSRDQALKAKQSLEMVGANIVGVVLNQKKIERDQGYYYYYGE